MKLFDQKCRRPLGGEEGSMVKPFTFCKHQHFTTRLVICGYPCLLGVKISSFKHLVLSICLNRCNSGGVAQHLPSRSTETYIRSLELNRSHFLEYIRSVRCELLQPISIVKRMKKFQTFFKEENYWLHDSYPWNNQCSAIEYPLII